jgi:ubiquinone/menaquinone biosynthesis C-methylase UbiE
MRGPETRTTFIAPATVPVLEEIGLYGRDFAEVYSKYGYAEFSANVADLLPRVLARLRVKPKTILDVPCGEGTFSIKMAKKGFQVTGVDRSEGMLGVARQKARASRAKVRFVKNDVRTLPFQEEFDLVTSWYDSLNYLLREEDLRAACRSVFRALRPEGLFLFDMNTPRTLSKTWVLHPSFVEVDTPEAFVIHRSRWDARKQVSDLKVTLFVRRGTSWRRIDELHQERAFMLRQIRECLRRAGFTELACWGSIRRMTPPRAGVRKYWFAAER